MSWSPSVRRTVAVLIAAGCALAGGCLTNDPGRKTDSAKPGEARAKPPAQFDDHDPNASRVVLRPQLQTVPVGDGQVFIVTVYDADGKPRRRRKIEWMVEGPGSIIEVDDGGYVPGRGIKSAPQLAFSQTASDEHHLVRGKDEFTVRPGQTWCIVKSAVEGQTTVTAHCPAINDQTRGRATATLYWTDKNMQFPAPATARAGSECVLSTSIGPPGDGSAGYRVRYRILDGPAAALTSGGGAEVDSVSEAVAPIGEDGTGQIHITQPLATAGTNRIGIEVMRADPAHPGQTVVVSRGETRVTWQAPRLDVSVFAPKFLALNQDAAMSFTVGSSGTIDPGPVTLTAKLPPAVVLIDTEPKATVDEDTLIWTLPAVTAGKPVTVKATVRPTRLGSATLAADVRTEDGLTGHGSCAVSVAEARLLLKVTGPASGITGSPLPFQVTVTNAGDGPADHIRVQGRLDDGLELANHATTVDQTIATLAAGQSKTLPLSLSARHAGKLGLQVSASADRGLVAVPQSATVDVKDAQLSLSVHGPARGYIGQQVVWNVVVRNTGDVPMGGVALKAALPAEVAFVQATNGGKASGKQLAWDLGTLAAREERTVAVTTTCNKAAARAVVTASVTGSPVPDGPSPTAKSAKPIASPPPAETAIEIVGVPALQISVKCSANPALVGQRITYTVRVTNTGTMPAQKIVLTADVPEQTTATRGTGPGAAASVANRHVAFPVLDTLAPNAEATFVVEAEAKVTGDGRFTAEVRSASQAQPLHAAEPTKVIVKDSRPFER